MGNIEGAEFVRRLAMLCPPPGSPTDFDRSRTNQEERQVPADYRRLAQMYGPGCFDEFLWIFVERAENEHLDLVKCTNGMRSIFKHKNAPVLESALAEFGATVEDLVQWGVTDNADMLAWIAKGDPDSWPTVVIQAGQLDVFISSKSSTETLLDLLTGAMRPPFFPSDFPSEQPEFSANPYS
ncbi:hypothetical protein [Streptomyces sp. NPDC047043]|uniref:hypothetical protein n=1 Tax=Streptomyces sp. NPDC047043 TaxID=3154497 RepID=UPI0033E69D8E